MYAMIHSYRLSPNSDFPLETARCRPGNRRVDPAVSGSRGLRVYNAPRFNCDSTAYPRTLRLSAVMTRLLPARRSIAQGQ
jgi:hypothetical protein